jgi:hypothetical protein
MFSMPANESGPDELLLLLLPLLLLLLLLVLLLLEEVEGGEPARGIRAAAISLLTKGEEL